MRSARSAQLHSVLVNEAVGRQLEVLRRWALADTAGVVVVRAMAGAEVAAPVA
eukprot:CAMPEP_0171284690 /NCGR_PEP_ID=MMETSP0790-20130122/68072_1 /TAXON_ID=2925 /ORGANISM="Alexandrium catenella, Strain OF101" /LENGTH=52 /DNA_ID=CAMNT_0011754001 /DNA_START=21 /DNA_END=176 /DNA_ORIENTATION=-